MGDRGASLRADAETLARCAVLLHCEAREVPQRVRALIRERELLQGKSVYGHELAAMTTSSRE